jgi:catechol-2,3-dioxygenase
MFQIESIDHVALIVQNVERAMKWYQDVLGMERRYQDVWTGKRDPVVMASGNVQVALFLPDGEGNIRAKDPYEHFAVRVDHANFEQARQELTERGITFRLRDHKICLSLYFSDIDGNEIEVTTFELV